jgi:hypothetical protein
VKQLFSYQTVGATAALERRVTYRKFAGGSRLGRSVRPTSDQPAGTILAKLADGPLSGSTTEVVAIEGRPPKTIDLDHRDGSVRYCLAEWQQSGHTAIYGFLYEV